MPRKPFLSEYESNLLLTVFLNNKDLKEYYIKIFHKRNINLPNKLSVHVLSEKKKQKTKKLCLRSSLEPSYLHEELDTTRVTSAYTGNANS